MVEGGSGKIGWWPRWEVRGQLLNNSGSIYVPRTVERLSRTS